MSQSHLIAARNFMAHKGYPDAAPSSVERIEGIHCWYVYYDLEEGTVELEVEYIDGEWQCTVVNFLDQGV